MLSRKMSSGNAAMMMKPAFVTTLSLVSPHQPSPPSWASAAGALSANRTRGQGEKVQSPAHRCPIICAQCVVAFPSCSAC